MRAVLNAITWRVWTFCFVTKYRQIPEQLVEVTGEVGTDHSEEEFLELSMGRDWVPMAFIRNVKEDTSTLEGD